MINLQSDNVKEMIKAFKVAAIWSSSYDEINEEGGIEQFTKAANNNTIIIFKDVFAIMNDKQIQVAINDPSQFGHSLALSLSGQGAGLFDLCDNMIELDAKIEALNFWNFDTVYETDSKELHFDLFCYGSKAYSETKA